MSSRSSFTLIELLVVIAIVAILAVVVILALNPAELLKQSRDSEKLSDIATLSNALSIYITDTGSNSLGSTTLIYISIPDPTATTTAGTDCSGLGFPSGYYHCAASSTYRKTDGTGWIPVNFNSISSGAPMSLLPVDPTNSTSSHFYYSYFPGSGTFKLMAIPESVKYGASAGGSNDLFEVGTNMNLGGGYGWVLVPGNSAYGTPNFWVMKYEAKCVTTGTTAGLTAPDTGSHTYSNTTTPCTAANSKGIASVPDGYPITNISHDTSKTYCSSIGAHLLTNDEYMTIARNAEQVASNWSGGAVGSGYMYSGHNDNSPALALAASANDASGYYGETNTGGSQRRTLTLSNGSVVWDFSGNIWQHVQRSTNNAGDASASMALPACTGGGGWTWCQFSGVSAWSSDVPQASITPSNLTWNATQGVGQLYTYGTGANQGTTIFLRGARWLETSDAGLFSITLGAGAPGYGPDLGFRCAR